MNVANVANVARNRGGCRDIRCARGGEARKGDSVRHREMLTDEILSVSNNRTGRQTPS